MTIAGAVLLSLDSVSVRAQEVNSPVRAIVEPTSLIQPRAVTSLDIDPAGERVLATGLDGAVRVWTLATGAAGPVFQIHEGDAAKGFFMPDGRRILSTGADGRAVLFDAVSGTEIRTWRFPTWCLGLAIASPHRAAVGCADLKIRVLNLDDGAIEREMQAPGDIQYQYVGSISASPDGRLLTVVNPATLFDLETGEQLQTSNSFLQDLVFSPDGRRLLGGNMKAGAQLWSVEALRSVKAFVTDVEQEAQTPSGRTAARQNMPIYGVAWSPGGRFFATGGLDRLVRIWRIEGDDAVETARLEGHASAISALAWSQDYLVSGDLGGHIRIWRLEGVDRKLP